MAQLGFTGSYLHLQTSRAPRAIAAEASRKDLHGGQHEFEEDTDRGHGCALRSPRHDALRVRWPGRQAARHARRERRAGSELLKMPHMTPAIVKGLIAKRNFNSIVDLNKYLLGAGSDAGRRRRSSTAAHSLHVNLNTGTPRGVPAGSRRGQAHGRTSSRSTGRGRASRSSTRRSASTTASGGRTSSSSTCSSRSTSIRRRTRTS